MHPPDQAKHNKPSLDANGRLEVIFYDVLCIDLAKNRRWRLSYDQLPPDCPIGSRSGKSAQYLPQILGDERGPGPPIIIWPNIKIPVAPPPVQLLELVPAGKN